MMKFRDQEIVSRSYIDYAQLRLRIYSFRCKDSSQSIATAASL